MIYLRVAAWIPLVFVELIGEWLNERATRKTEALLSQMVRWWGNHSATREADYKAAFMYWVLNPYDRVAGRPIPMPMPRPGPPARMRM